MLGNHLLLKIMKGVINDFVKDFWSSLFVGKNKRLRLDGTKASQLSRKEAPSKVDRNSSISFHCIINNQAQI